jgi:branched-chain amino acid transport system permease protein
VRWLETGPTILGQKFPEVLGLSGVVLGSVIVLIMALRPGGIMGDREIEDFILKK